MPYFELDADGIPIGQYARPQPGKNLLHLPDPPGDDYRWDGEQWVVILSKLKEQKINELRQACRAHIFAGFDSDALGTIHHYPMSQTDQANLQKNEVGAIKNADNATWRCVAQCIPDGETEQRYVEHTAAQMAQVADDIDDGKNATLRKLQGLVDDTTAIADDDPDAQTKLNAIQW